MIKENNGIFTLETEHTSYLFGVMETGHLEHFYYGRTIHFRDDAALREKHAFAPGNGIYYDDGHKNFSLEDTCLEMSSYGKGDIREPSKLVNESQEAVSIKRLMSLQVDFPTPDFRFTTFTGEWAREIRILAPGCISWKK